MARKSKKDGVAEEIKIAEPITQLEVPVEITEDIVSEDIIEKMEPIQVREGIEGKLIAVLEPESPTIQVIDGRFESFETKRIVIPEGCKAVVSNQGVGDIYIKGYINKYISSGATYESEGEVLEIMAPSRPFFSVTIIKK